MPDFEAMQSELLDTLIGAMKDRANTLGWTATPSQELLEQNGDTFTPTLAALPREGAAPAQPGALPSGARAIELQPTSITLLICSLDPKNAISYRDALWWSGLVRSGLAPTKRGDLHLFLVAPAGSRDDEHLRNLRSRYEADERFCRKFVWLPPHSPTQDDVVAFLDRTLLAQPWQGKSAEPRSLDPLEQLAEAGAGQRLTAEQARRWISRLGAPETAGAPQLAEDLVGLLLEES